MRQPLRFIRFSTLVISFCLMVFLLAAAPAAAQKAPPRGIQLSSVGETSQPVVWSEDWSDGWGLWYADNGVWDVGNPSSGPGQAYSDTMCTATVLDGNYPDGANSRLISPPVLLPSLPQDGALWLSFWQWFSIAGYDRGYVEISVNGTPWVTLSNNIVGSCGGVWTKYIADLSSYAGQSVRFAFHIVESYPSVGPGWYVDDIFVVEGVCDPWPLESFEGNVDCWYADSGVWEIGEDPYGPSRGAFAGNFCAGTVLGGNYPGGANSRLISPPIDLPSSPQDGALWLSFWHWFNIAGYDRGYVEISAEGGAWEILSNDFVGYSGGVWTNYIADLSGYIDQSVRIAFHIVESYPNVGPGWYIDLVNIEEGNFDTPNPLHFENKPWAYRPLFDGWYASNGVWQVGEPGAGPESAFGGRICAGTVLDGDYPGGANSRLISPAINLPSSPQDGALWLSFWHWFSIGGYDRGYVEISVDGGSWESLSSDFIGSCGGVWTNYIADLSGYVGQSVRIAFHIVESYPSVGVGWYVDNFSIVEGPKIFNNPEGFETGTRGWYASRGVWEIGEPTSGPGAAYNGSFCAGTVLDGNYPGGCDSRLVSPKITIPGPSCLMRIVQWFSFSTDDRGIIEISADGGPWTQVSSAFTGNSSDWSPYIADLAAYSGQTVQFAFRIIENYPSQGSGWYIDDFQVICAPETAPDAPNLLSVEYTAGPPVLNWVNPSGDYEYISIYAGQDSNFVPDLGSRIALLNGTTFTDTDRPGWGTYYRLSAVDADWHESGTDGPTIVAVEDESPILSRTELHQNHPNPFNPTTTIEFNLSKAGPAAIEVYDVGGRRVATILDEFKGAGPHSVTFNASGLTSGVYFYRLRTNDFERTRKMVILK